MTTPLELPSMQGPQAKDHPVCLTSRNASLLLAPFPLCERSAMSALCTLTFLLASIFALGASAAPVDRVDPPNWWVGFENPSVELLVHGEGAGHLTPRVRRDGVRISDHHSLENPNYLSVTLQIDSDAHAGVVPIDFTQGERTVAHVDYALQERRPDSRSRRGFDAHDTMYLIMPDRFANGSAANDAAKGTRDHTDRNDPNARHGGDLKGITEHLDFLQGMGYTQLWLTPVMENDMPGYSYHGYSITDHYATDPRFGSNEEYRQLADAARCSWNDDVWQAVQTTRIKGARADYYGNWIAALNLWACAEPGTLVLPDAATRQVLERFTLESLRAKAWPAAEAHPFFAHLQTYLEEIGRAHV